MDKKGQTAVNILVISVTLLIVAIALIIIFRVGKTMDINIQADSSMTADAKQISSDTVDKFPRTWDNVFMIVVIGLWIVSMVTSYFIETHPIFWFISIILLVIVLFAPMLMGNLFENITTSDAQFYSDSQQFPKMTWIFGHLLEVCIVIGMSEILMLYAKMRE